MSKKELFIEKVLKHSKNNSIEGTFVREGEVRIGQTIHTLGEEEHSDIESFLIELKSVKDSFNPKYAIIGIEEDIGPRANYGKSGAVNGWEAFLQIFLNMQDTKYLKGVDMLLVGKIDLSDLQEKSLEVEFSNNPMRLSELVIQIDKRVEVVISALLHCGYNPIVIGGGHNNAYPIIKSLSKYYNKNINVINLDPHSDCRPLEGRHSGNPFSCCFSDEIINKYILVGMDPFYNSAKSIECLEENNAEFENCMMTNLLDTYSQDELIGSVLRVLGEDKPTFTTIDCDAIEYMPSSAKTNIGLTPSTAFSVIKNSLFYTDVKALFLAEGAPKIDNEDEMKYVGKFLSYCVSKYVQKSI